MTGRDRPGLASQGGSGPVGRRGMAVEVAAVFLAATLACAFLARLAGVVPLVRDNLYLAVGLVFLYFPVLALRLRGEWAQDFGLTAAPVGRNLAVAGLAALLTFPPYLPAFHWYQVTLFHQRPDFSADLFWTWPAEWEGRPDPIPDGGLYVFTRGPHLHLGWTGRGDDTPEFRVETDARVEVVAGEEPHRVTFEGPGVLRVGPGAADGGKAAPQERGGEVVLALRGGETVRIFPFLGGAPPAPGLLRVGASGISPLAASGKEGGALVGRRSLAWLPWLVLVQFLLVAIPEEFFFRGYIQGRLDRLLPHRLRLFGVSFSPLSLLTTSALFALGHYLVDFHPARLGVFFPSLLFGILKDSTRSIGGAAIYHAACNVYVEVLSHGYVPGP